MKKVSKKVVSKCKTTKLVIKKDKRKASANWNTFQGIQLESEHLVVGVDISKDYFDADISGKGCQFSQDSVGFTAFSKCLLPGCHVVMEATGGYQYGLCTYLLDKGIKVSVVNPQQARNYAKSQGFKAKTDKIDAKMLTSFGDNQIRAGRLKLWEMPSDESVKVENLLKLSELLKDRIQQDKQRLACWQLNPACSKEGVEFQQKMIEDQIEQLRKVEEEIDKFVQTQKEDKKLLESIPGIGKQTVKYLLLLLMSDKKFKSPKEMSAYIGTDPNVGTSGTTVKQAGHIRKEGYRQLRTLLYMCALSAKKYNKACKELYDRLLAKGKKKKVALIAVVNKLLKQIFAIYSNKTKYEDNYISKNKTTNTTNISGVA
jgi:transposase